MNDKPTILLLDDDKFLIGMYATKFRNAGYTIEAVLSGEAALEKIKGGFHPNIIVADIIMPGMSGIDFVDKVRKDRLAEGAIVVMLTNESDNVEINRAKALHVNGYIVKATTIPSEVVDEVMKIYNAKGTQ